MSIPEPLLVLHHKAVELSTKYKKSEAELLEIIVQIRQEKVYLHLGYASLYEYCVKELKLDAGAVYGFTAVAKKITEVPELKTQIKNGQFNVSTARRITSVLTSENKNEWFENAANLSQKKLEKEIARVNPKTETPERASYLTSRRVKLELGLDEELMLEFRCVQELESQRCRRFVNLEETRAEGGSRPNSR